MNDPSHRKTLAHLYAVFAGVTHDLIDMLKWIDSVGSSNEVAEYAHNYVASGDGWKCLDHIHHISDRDIIEMIFQSLDLTCQLISEKSDIFYNCTSPLFENFYEYNFDLRLIMLIGNTTK
ncbi:unnamed protein product [Rotaria sordida]|uniref:Uncharacterized protein n=2 Tax=Rotaria sordida TaxID=392033 RepID=A0A819U0X7_9BILA|nr:unnamed protein product [Rotaria sordida]